jgi:hypothetical protein
MRRAVRLGVSNVVPRALAVIAAIFLVGGIAIAMLFPANMPLAQMIYTIDGNALDWVESSLRKAIPAWAWAWVVLPMLVRPAWLLPASIGIVAAGLSITFTRRAETGSPRRRRS